uniref:Uncharacterized protein n=1 Tax=Panagrolaimus davidi TaxID=227884 RepID=A0A914P9N5_9BILA
MNKIHTDKQLFPPFMIQNPFEFPRQQEKEQINEPEVVGFRASQRLLGSNQPTSSNAIRIPTAVAGSHVSNINRGYPPIRLVRPNLVLLIAYNNYFLNFI